MCVHMCTNIYVYCIMYLLFSLTNILKVCIISDKSLQAMFWTRQIGLNTTGSKIHSETPMCSLEEGTLGMSQASLVAFPEGLHNQSHATWPFKLEGPLDTILAKVLLSQAGTKV